MMIPLSGLGSLPGVGGSGGVGGLPKPTVGTDDQSAGGGDFGAMLKDMVIEKPGQSQAAADQMAAKFAAGDTSIDPAQLAIASAKAGVDVQMSTRVITQAVSGVKQLFQMQI